MLQKDVPSSVRAYYRCMYKRASRLKTNQLKQTDLALKYLGKSNYRFKIENHRLQW